MNPRVSIIICTCNRADSLRETLASIGRCEVPADLSTELLVVDNGSCDHTARVVSEANLSNLCVRYISVPSPGKSNALNLAVARSRGEILLCTDDDVRVERRWIETMCRPIAGGVADAAVGARIMPDHLRRSWMEPAHFDGLACSEGRPEADLVGSNMAFSRGVLTQVPLFDTEIGPPAACGEDMLFSRQLSQAHFKIASIPDAPAEHHFDPKRLTRASMRDAALKGAASDFYIEYHWMHHDDPHPIYTLVRTMIRLAYYRVRHLRTWWTNESMPAWEMGMIQNIRKTWLFIRRRGEPRKYEKFGLRKLNEMEAGTGAGVQHSPAGEVQWAQK